MSKKNDKVFSAYFETDLVREERFFASYNTAFNWLNLKMTTVLQIKEHGQFTFQIRLRDSSLYYQVIYI